MQKSDHLTDSLYLLYL